MISVLVGVAKLSNYKFNNEGSENNLSANELCCR